MGRPIIVTSSNPDDATIRIQVADHGVGIEPDVLPGVFDAFEQGDSTRTRKFGGLGLGLTIAKALVESNGGSIRAESDGPNLGALLTVDLPTAVMPPVRPSRFPPAAELAPERAELRVLLVEDHAETRAIMVKLLRKLGHDVTTATCVKEALAVARDRAIDFIVSDIGLPDGSGHDVMRALCGQGAIKGIAVSGYGTEEDVQASLDAGFFRHLVKPIDLSRLQIAIQQSLAET
jgi:two-component system CheB/CheR fusion protein